MGTHTGVARPALQTVLWFTGAFCSRTRHLPFASIPALSGARCRSSLSSGIMNRPEQTGVLG